MATLRPYPNESRTDYINRLNAENKKINAYNARIYRDDPNYIFTGDVDGHWEALHINGTEGKAHLKKIAQIKEEADALIDARKNAVKYISEELEFEDSVTKIQIRQELDKVGAFSIENMKSIIDNLIEAGVEVK